MSRPSGIVAVFIATLVAGAAGTMPAGAAPPTCVQPPVQQVRPDVTTAVPNACTDPDNAFIETAVIDPPDHGTVSVGISSNIGYAPFDGYTGPDTFVLAGRTGDGYGPPVTYGIDVSASANQSPVCLGDRTPRVRVGATVRLTLGCSDLDGDVVTFAVTAAPSHGAAHAGAYDFGPVHTDYVDYSPDAVGDDTLAVTATDGRAETTVQYTVGVIADDAVGEGPVCAEALQSTQANAFLPTCTDPEGDEIRLEVVGQPAHGTAAVDGRRIVYTPAGGYTGADTVSYRGVDDHAAGPVRTFDVHVPDPTPSCAPADALAVRPGGRRSLFISCTSGSGPANPVVTDPPDHGTLTGGFGSYTYSADAAFTGNDAFTLTPSANGVTGTPRTYAVTVSPSANAVPTCARFFARSARGAAVVVPSGCGDDDGDTLTYAVVDPPAHGALSDASPTQVTYTPAAGFAGTDAFTVRADDGHGGVAIARHEIVVTAQGSNNPPFCAGSTAFTTPGQPVALWTACSDSDGDSITLAVVNGPAHGTLTGTTYTPAAGFVGEDTIVMRPSDTTSTGPRFTVTVEVGQPSSLPDPVCSAIGTSVVASQTRRVTPGCRAFIGEPSSVEVVSGPSHGTTGAVTGGRIPYTASADFTGTDTFSYRAGFPGLGATPTFTAPAIVTVDVRPPHDVEPGPPGDQPGTPPPAGTPAPPASPISPATRPASAVPARVPAGFALVRGLGGVQLALPTRAVRLRRDGAVTVGVLRCPTGCSLRWTSTLRTRAAASASPGVVQLAPGEELVLGTRLTAAQRRAVRRARRPVLTLRLRLREGGRLHAVTRAVRLKDERVR